MPSTPPRGEVRPTDTVDYPTVPLLRLRRRGREPIPPEDCLLGPDCLVCRWRRAGLLRSPLLDRPTDAHDRAEAA